MKKIITDTPTTNAENLLNFAYVENGDIYIREFNGEKDVNICDVVRMISEIADRTDILDDFNDADMMDAFIGEEINYAAAMLILATQAAELRGVVKREVRRVDDGRYVDADMVFDVLHGLGGCDAETDTWAEGWDDAINAVISEIEELPAADVEPVKRGKWMETEWKGTCGGDFYEKACSNYKEYALIDVDDKFDYCPYCGAKMEGETENERNMELLEADND